MNQLPCIRIILDRKNAVRPCNRLNVCPGNLCRISQLRVQRQIKVQLCGAAIFHIILIDRKCRNHADRFAAAPKRTAFARRGIAAVVDKIAYQRTAAALLISVRVVQRHFDRIAEARQIHVAVIFAVVHVVDCIQIPLNRVQSLRRQIELVGRLQQKYAFYINLRFACVRVCPASAGAEQQHGE